MQSQQNHQLPLKHGKTSLSQIIAGLGPGLMYAGAAVGVSHLVQSTKAGALFGLEMIIYIIAVHLIKYPFLEAGPRYTASTGKNLLEAYAKLGKWALWLYIAMTVSSMFIIQSAITVVTAGLAANIFGLAIKPTIISAGILAFCSLLLISGRYSVLDRFVKFIIITLTAASLTSVLLLLAKGESITAGVTPFSFEDNIHVLFLITLLGWMPAPMDISIWHSLWAQNHARENGIKTYKNALLDFRIGFIGTALLALCFLLLGALIMYGSGEKFSPKAVVFAGQLIALYKNALGSWATPLIAIAAFTTMLSTSLTCLDAFPRSLAEAQRLLSGRAEKNNIRYRMWLGITVSGSCLILFLLMKNMKTMIDLATTIAFVAAPVIALLNYMVMTSDDIQIEHRPTKLGKVWYQAGIATLTAFSLCYLIM